MELPRKGVSFLEPLTGLEALVAGTRRFLLSLWEALELVDAFITLPEAFVLFDADRLI